MIRLRRDRDQRRQLREGSLRLVLSKEFVQVDPLDLRLLPHQFDGRAAERNHLLADAEPFLQQSIGPCDPFRRDDRVRQGVLFEQVGMVPQEQVHPVLRIPAWQTDLRLAEQVADSFDGRSD